MSPSAFATRSLHASTCRSSGKRRRPSRVLKCLQPAMSAFFKPVQLRIHDHSSLSARILNSMQESRLSNHLKASLSRCPYMSSCQCLKRLRGVKVPRLGGRTQLCNRLPSEPLTSTPPPSRPFTPEEAGRRIALINAAALFFRCVLRVTRTFKRV